MEKKKIDWSGVQLFIAGVCCLACLILGTIIGATITQKNVDRRIEKAQKEIRSEIQKIEEEKRIELNRLTDLIEKYLQRRKLNGLTILE